ncbi:MAG: aldo/keto reductase [Solirubrobacterales bacterium]|nr:aldo/keto reductase [Solirubrobacterales bacterium]
MRFSTEAARDDGLAAETIAAALEAGITVFDTAHAYGQGENDLGRGERLLARALTRAGARARTGAGTPRGARAGAPRRARVITKGGMTRPAGAWVPDGRAKAILRDCEASLTALDGVAIDLYLLHAPDPRTPWRTSLRALKRLLDEGLVPRVGLSNVNRGQLDDALEILPVAAIQVALSFQDDRALRAGLVERCEEVGIALIAHSPLGGPRRAGGLARHAALADAAASCAATAAELALAWLLQLSPEIVAIPGARRPETARSAARAAALMLAPETTAALHVPRPIRRAPSRRSDHASVVLVMGIPGAGKTRLAEEYRARGYLRLNRDERGGALRDLAEELERRLGQGTPRIVLDNTYLTRSARSYVVDAAARRGVPVRCVWLETPLAQAQVNLVERLLERFGVLPTPEQLRELARREPGALAPTQQMRALRELEPPSLDEGFATVEVMPFTRTPPVRRTRTGVFIAASALCAPGHEQALEQPGAETPYLVFDWIPHGAADALEPMVARVRATVGTGLVEAAFCPHGGGPPRCWCRPPLPGLPLAFARSHGIDLAGSVLIGTSAAHRTLARALGVRYKPA